MQVCASKYTILVTCVNLTGHDDTLEEARCADTHANSVVNTPWPALLTVSMDLSVACSLNTEWVHGVRVVGAERQAIEHAVQEKTVSQSTEHVVIPTTMTMHTRPYTHAWPRPLP